MRSPVVKRHPIPGSGFVCCCFRVWRAGGVSPRRRVLTSFPYRGADGLWLHHTRLEALALSGRWRVQRNCDMRPLRPATSLSPPPGLFTEGAARVPFASSCQGRERGSPPQPGWTIAVGDGAEAGVPATRRARGQRPTGAGAFATQVCTMPEPSLRLLPRVAREAPGSPASLLAPRRTVGRAQAVLRCTRSSPARANFCARTRNACPLRGVLSQRARDFCPAGVARHQSPAASEKAPFREAGPILVPALP
jgi:hypothetical protein